MATTTSKSPPTITTTDGTVIYYKDWGSGQPIVFSHGWPLSADAWDDQLFVVASNGFRGGGVRPARSWPLEPAVGRQRHGSLCRRSRRELIEHSICTTSSLSATPPAAATVTRYIGRHGTSA